MDKKWNPFLIVGSIILLFVFLYSVNYLTIILNYILLIIILGLFTFGIINYLNWRLWIKIIAIPIAIALLLFLLYLYVLFFGRIGSGAWS